MRIFTTTAHGEDPASMRSRKDDYWNDLAAPLSFQTLEGAQAALDQEYREEYDDVLDEYFRDDGKPPLDWVVEESTNPEDPRKRTWTAIVGWFGDGNSVAYRITELEVL